MKVLVVALALTALTACAPDPPAAVVGIVVDSCDPGLDQGSGVLVAPGLALTSAHVLAGAQAITVDHDAGSSDGTIVGFDPEMDLAYVSFAAPRRQPMPVAGERVAEGDDGVVYVVRDDEVVVLPATVTRRVNIDTEDIYIQGETTRPGIEIQADIEFGDSGGALVVDGRVVGVIWARSNRFPGRAYAIDPVRAGDRIERQLATGDLGDVDVTRCH